jgi:hypothetical protein
MGTTDRVDAMAPPPARASPSTSRSGFRSAAVMLMKLLLLLLLLLMMMMMMMMQISSVISSVISRPSRMALVVVSVNELLPTW